MIKAFCTAKTLQRPPGWRVGPCGWMEGEGWREGRMVAVGAEWEREAAVGLLGRARMEVCIKAAWHLGLRYVD